MSSIFLPCDEMFPEQSEAGRLRQHNGCAQATGFQVVQPNVAAMRANSGPCHCQAQASASGLPTAAGLEPVERIEDPLDLVLRYTRTIVCDGDDDLVIPLRQRDPSAHSIFHRIFD